MQILILLSLMISLIASEIAVVPADWQVAGSPGSTLALTAASTLAVAIMFLAANLLAIRQLDRFGKLNRRAYRRLLSRLTWLMLFVFACQLFLFRWASLASGALDIPVLNVLAVWAPFPLMLLSFWAAGYPVDVRLRLVDLSQRLTLGMPVYPAGSVRAFWSLRQFLAFQIRFQLLLILLPLLAILTLKTLVERVHVLVQPHLQARLWTAEQIQSLLAVMLMSVSICVLVLAPPVLARVFSSRPLPCGALRDKLLLAIQRLGVRVRQVLLWDTHGMVSNAAVMGPWGRLRYVLLSDALLETLPDEQIEGVFGHELGHVVHHHLLYYLLLLVGLLVWGGYAGTAIISLGAVQRLMAASPLIRLLIDGGLLLIIVAGMLTVFGWISRRFEWQADLTGAQSILLGPLAQAPLAPAGTSADRPDDLTAQPPSAPDGALHRPPHPAAAEIYLAGLFRIADINGLDRGQWTWRHGSIAGRGEHLRRLYDPKQFRRFQFTIRFVKLAILALSAGAAAVFVWSL